MAKRIQYRCVNPECGYITSRRYMTCPKCGSDFEEVKEEKTAELKNSQVSTKIKKAVRLVDVDIKNEDRIVTGIKEFDRVMGGGLLRDSISIISAPPGKGKTTLLLEVCNAIAEQGLNILYASGEESEVQLKRTALRILDKINDNFYIMGTNQLDDVIEEARKKDIDFIVVDSIHRFRLADFASHTIGSPTQIRECFNALKSLCKDGEKKVACFMVGQVTKEDELKGARELEHDVDVVLELSDETDSSEIRFLRAIKNRFGGPETGIFKMTDKGILSLDNPSEYFVTHRQKNEDVSGIAISVIMDGTRPIVIEIEALASPSPTMYPTRIATCMKKDSLNILLAVLRQKADTSSNVNTNDIIINTTTGIYLKERVTDLSVIMAVNSALSNEIIKEDVVYLAEVGLTGELKNVPSVERRIKEVERLGYKHVVVSSNESIDESKFESIQIHKAENVLQAIICNKKIQREKQS